MVFISSCFSEYTREAWLGSPGYLTGFITYIFFAILFVFAYSTALNFPVQTDKIIDIWLLSVALIALIGLLQYLGGLKVSRDNMKPQLTQNF